MKNNKLEITDVKHLFKEYHTQEGNGAWGSLHIVLEDYNIKDDSVKFCIKHARDKGDTIGELLGLILLTMSTTQRLKLSHE